MGVNFPSSPTNGQTVNVGNTLYSYNSTVGAWEIVSSGGMGTMTTKGDLLSRSSSGLARVGIGTNDYVLTADSSATPGMSWGTSPKVIANAAARPSSPYEGQMVYESDTDLLLIWNGSAWKALMQATSVGSILQVVNNQPTFSDQSITSTNETLFINPLATITPKQSTSKILIFFTFGAYPTGFHNYYSLFIRRGAVGAANKIASNGGGWQGDWTLNYQMTAAASYGVSAHQQYSVHAFDNAGTTSTINYVLTGINTSGSASSSLILWSGAINRVTLMEIAQ